jgi:5-formyltetrahydrofolate cyclo-ligase
MVPDFLLIPLLAFDSGGRRLGYGGGFYDRTLAALPRRFRLGCGFAAQQVDAVPIGPYDMMLDAVATEQGIMRFPLSPVLSATPGRPGACRGNHDEEQT